MSATAYDVLLVDADDTLFDFPAAERAALADTLRAFDLSCDAANLALYHDINRRMWALLERGGIDQATLRVQRFQEFIDALGEERDAIAMGEHFVCALGGQAIPLPGAEAAIARWAQRVPVVIITNGIAAVQRARFARSPMRAHIAGMAISEEVGAAKPDARMVHAALALVPGAKPERALLLGDSLRADIGAAHNAGIASCWFNPHQAPLTGDVVPTYTVTSLDEVDAYLP